MTDQPPDDETLRSKIGLAASVVARHADTRQGVIDYLFGHRYFGPWLRKQPDPDAAALAAALHGEDILGPIICGYLEREERTGRQEPEPTIPRSRRDP